MLYFREIERPLDTKRQRKIKDWYFIEDSIGSKRLCGRVIEDSEKDFEEVVTRHTVTSVIRSHIDNIVITESGSTYELIGPEKQNV